MTEVNTPTITQEEYRAILEADTARALEKFQEFPEAEPRQKWRCRKCGTPANVTIVAHPIWNGPFDGAGTGACDYRELPSAPDAMVIGRNGNPAPRFESPSCPVSPWRLCVDSPIESFGSVPTGFS